MVSLNLENQRVVNRYMTTSHELADRFLIIVQIHVFFGSVVPHKQLVVHPQSKCLAHMADCEVIVQLTFTPPATAFIPVAGQVTTVTATAVPFPIVCVLVLGFALHRLHRLIKRPFRGEMGGLLDSS